AREGARGRPATGETMKSYEDTLAALESAPRTWLVTGAAGFIGSNLLEAPLGRGQKGIGLDNFSTGSPRDPGAGKERLSRRQWAAFRFIEGDIRSLDTCRRASRAAQIVLHQAALGSVPRSIENPVGTHDANVTGFVNMLTAAHGAGVKRFVYASSS